MYSASMSYPASLNDLLPVPVFGDAAFAAESKINNIRHLGIW